MSPSGALAWSLLVAPHEMRLHICGGFHRDISLCLSNQQFLCHCLGASHLLARTDADRSRPREGKEGRLGAAVDAPRSWCVMQQSMALREAGTPHRHPPSRFDRSAPRQGAFARRLRRAGAREARWVTVGYMEVPRPRPLFPTVGRRQSLVPPLRCARRSDRSRDNARFCAIRIAPGRRPNTTATSSDDNPVTTRSSRIS